MISRPSGAPAQLMIRLLLAPASRRAAFGAALAALAAGLHFYYPPARLEPIPHSAWGPLVTIAALLGRRAGGLAALCTATLLIRAFDAPDTDAVDLVLFFGKWLAVVVIAGFVHDLWLRAAEHERIAAEEARLAQQRLELALESGAIGTFEVDLVSNDIRLNEKHREIFGWTSDQLVTTSLLDSRVVEEDLAGLLEARARALTGKERFHARIRIRRANDGALRHIETHGHVHFERGAPVRVFGATRDITDEMEAAASLEERARLAEQSHIRALELERERSRLALALEAGAIGTFEADLARDEIHLSEKLRDIWGWTGDAPVKPGVLDALVIEEDRAARRQAIARAREDGGRYNARFRIRRAADGAVRWIDTRGQVYFDGETPIRVLGVTRDITDEMEAARVLHEKARLAEQMSMLAEALPGAIYSYVATSGAGDRLAYAAPNIDKLLGFSAEDLGRDLNLLKDRFHPEDAPLIFAAIEESARSLGAWRATFRYAHPTRGEIWIEGNSQPMRDHDGATIWHGFLQDVTARETAARALAESEAQVRALMNERVAALEDKARLAERLSILAEALPGAIYTYVRPADGNAFIPYVSPNVEGLLGFNADAFRHDLTWFWKRVHPDDGAPLAAAEQASARDLVRWKALFRYDHPDKGEIWVEGDGQPRRLEDGATVTHGYLHDVTAREISARALAESEARVRALKDERLAALEKMAARLAHEVNQPLAAAATLLAVGRRRLAPPRDGRDAGSKAAADALDKAVHQLLRAGQIVTRVREFSQHGEADKTFRSLHETIRETLVQLDADSTLAGFEIALRLEAARDRVLIDRVQIAAVIANLLLNAAQACLAEARRTIVVASRNQQDNIEISVIDYGSGLSEDARRHLFELFWTSKGSGMGVGLAMAKAIVEAHYGTIWPQDATGEETVFTFSLPLVDRGDIPGASS
jgi:two-component system, LuxR family, sensor kinase FixL